MSRIIGLNSFNLFETPKYLEVRDEEFSFETLFAVDRTIREVVSIRPDASWVDVEDALKSAGFGFAANPSGHIFWHSRHWDEHLTPAAKSFFVSFPESAPYELAGEVVYATNYPGLITVVPEEYFTSDKLLLVNSNHEPIFPADLAWGFKEDGVQIPLGPVEVIADQFLTPEGVDEAKTLLVTSGYSVCELVR